MYATQLRLEGDVPAGKRALRTGPDDALRTPAYDELTGEVTYGSSPYEIRSDAEMIAVHGGAFPNEETRFRYCTIHGAPGWETADDSNVIPCCLVGGFKRRIDHGNRSPGRGGHHGRMLEWLNVTIPHAPLMAIQAAVGSTNLHPFGHPRSLLGEYRLGKVSMRVAREVKVRVEGLTGFAKARVSPDPENAEWVKRIGPDLSGKLASMQLISHRAAIAVAPTLAGFVDSFLASRTQKENTFATFLQARKVLVSFFGEARAIDAISGGFTKVPVFPEMRKQLADAFDTAPEGATYVVGRDRSLPPDSGRGL